jgi:hypothetical protein
MSEASLNPSRDFLLPLHDNSKIQAKISMNFLPSDSGRINYMLGSDGGIETIS